MEYRRLDADDIDALVDELWLTFSMEMAELDSYNELGDDVRDHAIEYRQANLDDPDTATFVAERDDDLIGYTVVTYSESPPVFARGPSANIEEVYVSPTHRGEGIANALMDRAESWAQARECSYVQLSVNERNETARAVYRSRGYGVRRFKMDKRLDS
ncbi:GNAT family N-acetyltransferase [Halovivax gelatinilyticus]|uniref:GNAT family N-acetyltransferase n=1 Tax=Halovivax gelatinilyticus TaxID=2961597 RepID=UPI0020CA60E1|nr:GNAT family N-acetyltransferase [Halovivax gelatinilyticus]